MQMSCTCTSFWIINNSQQVLSSLSYLNKVSRAKHFDSFDFTTLYTNIPHDTLKTNLGALIEEAFKVRGAKYLSKKWCGLLGRMSFIEYVY